MNVEVIKNDAAHIIHKVMCNDNLVSWSSSGDEAYFLIVRSEYGKEFDLEEKAINYLRNVNSVAIGEDIDVLDNLSLFVFKRQLLLGYKCNYRPARYSVFVCNYIQEDNKLIIYINESASTYCDVSEELKLVMESVNNTSSSGGFFSRLFSGKSNNARSYVRLTLDGDNPVGYTDGALYYTYPDYKYEYPITKKMLKNGFYAPLYNNTQPVIKSSSKGYIGRILKGV